jgi:hypothetical protein
MKIRKSRLKQIIQEEVENFKFIDVRESIMDGSAATEDAEAKEQESEDDTGPVGESNSALDELVVQEIIRALGETGGDKKHDEDEEEKRGGAIDPQTDTTKRDDVPQLEEEKKDWLGDIEGTGECTPPSKPGCKGKAKAFALRMQPGGDLHSDINKGK